MANKRKNLNPAIVAAIIDEAEIPKVAEQPQISERKAKRMVSAEQLARIENETIKSNSAAWTAELKWILPLVLVAFVVFVNTLGGEFVYDDNRQIERNQLVQDVSQFGKAMTSDVWAFKGDGKAVASNYWRPTFVFWMILNFQMFGLAPAGWHLLNILLHVGVCVLAYLLMRRWNLSEMIAAAIALVFAVHPVHTESVAWIAGSPDLLFAAALLGALWFVQELAEGKSNLLNWAAAIGLFAVALGAKEVALLCPPLMFLLFWQRGRNGETRRDLTESVTMTAPFAAAAAIYFFARLSVIGTLSRPVEDAPSLSSAILTVPAAFVFYLRQIFFPLWMTSTYPLRPVAEIGAANFVLPLIISLAALAVLVWIGMKSLTGRIGLLLFVLPLIPAMNLTAFPFEQIVHDRYLYLPLLGLLLIIVPAFARFAEKRLSFAARDVLIVAAVISAVLFLRTWNYNTVWASNVNLWRHSAAADDNSAFVSSQLGAALEAKEDYAGSLAAYSRSLEIRPSTLAYMGRGRALLYQQRFAEAEQDLQKVTTIPPEQTNAYTLYQSYEALAIVYQQQQKFDAAANTLAEARQKLPLYTAALSTKLAVILYQGGKKNEALQILEQTRTAARRELLPESKEVFMRLGMLYAEAGKTAEARAALQEYLTLTAALKDKNTIQNRTQATNILNQLK